eukprot:2289555-Pyramimonas_sp.AAC.1
MAPLIHSFLLPSPPAPHPDPYPPPYLTHFCLNHGQCVEHASYLPTTRSVPLPPRLPWISHTFPYEERILVHQTERQGGPVSSPET